MKRNERKVSFVCLKERERKGRINKFFPLRFFPI